MQESCSKPACMKMQNESYNGKMPRSFIVPTLLLAVVLWPNYGVSADLSVRISETEGSVTIILLSSESIGFEHQVDGRELVLRFDGPIQSQQLQRLPQEIPLWVRGASSGYDTILIDTALDVHFVVDSEGREITIELTAMENPELPGVVDQGGLLRLDVLESQLLGVTGREADALRLVRRLGETHPNDIEILTNRAGLENHFRRFRLADDLYGRALELSPDNNDVRELRREARGEHASRIRLDFDHKDVQDAQQELISRLSGHVLLDNYLRIGAVVETNDIEVDNLRFADGDFGSFRGRRQRGEFSLEYDFRNGSGLGGAVYGGRSVLGAGAHYDLPDEHGLTSFNVDYRRPFWEFIEGLVGGGFRHRVDIRREQQLHGPIEGQFTLGLNRYGVDQVDDVTRSVGMEGRVTLPLLEGSPFLALEYGFEAEYRTSIRTLLDSSGIEFNPIPLVSREVHAPSVLLAHQVGRSLSAEAFAGYAWDRLGGKGPFGGARVTYRPAWHAEIQVWFERRLNSIATGQVVNRVGAHVFWRF